ncbi:hypothetical protein OAA49_00950 [Flavobacteriales bacterium]|jgi:hypothetical protein|nr:hypothetical protein [Flavobacteriales bacterium]MDB9702026.1 hypothetical protein [Flavobacteriales bacterium]
MKILFTLLFIIATVITTYAQNFELAYKKDPLVKITKSGPYLGFQYGKYKNLELGYELQRKAVKLVKPTTHAINIGLDFNFIESVMGLNLGYYQKKGRLDFTYGFALLYRTDFRESRIGISPKVGYKLYGFHLQGGINLLTPNKDFTNNNLFYASLKFVIIKNRNYNWRKREKKD